MKRGKGKRGGPPGRRASGGARRGGSQPRKARERGGGFAPERVLATLRGRDRPLLSAPAILRALGAKRDAVRRLRVALDDLEQAGRVERVGRRYRLRRRDGRVEGSFANAQDAQAKGGSVTEESGVVWRVADAAGARSGDHVLVQPIGDVSQRRGEIVAVLAGERSDWVGVFHRGAGKAFVTPYRDDGDWLVAIGRGDEGGAEDGEVVAVEPAPAARGKQRRKPRSSRGRELEAPRGRVVARHGRPGEPEADFRAIVWRRRLRVDFPRAVEDEVAALPDRVTPSEIARRSDLRELPFLTIDPASARDHDDALHVESLPGGKFRIRVAIADVAAFVPEGSAIDVEALRRGNSIYFPDRAIPMLPERLSGDLCSLRPDVDRLVWVAEFDVGARGKVSRPRFSAGVIRSRARIVYEQAAAVMAGEGDAGFAPEVAAQLRDLAEATRRLRAHRRAAGALELDLPEADILFGSDGRVEDVVAHPRTEAHRAVEDAMLAANRAVAEAVSAAHVPAVYRNHEPPLPQDEAKLVELFATFGLDVDPPREPARRGGASRSRAVESPGAGPGWISAALERAVGHREERLVHQTVLRSMTQARYGAECRGHFALAFAHYTHFTSPIRRYADLAVHRALQRLVGSGRNGPAARRGDRGEDGAAFERMERVAARTSWRERVAVEAEREANLLQKCAFLKGRVGETFTATMTGAAPFGLWLTLDAHFVDGLVHVSALPSFVEFDEVRNAFRARGSGERYELGDRFEIRVEAVDQIRARVDFRIVARLDAQP